MHTLTIVIITFIFNAKENQKISNSNLREKATKLHIDFPNNTILCRLFQSVLHTLVPIKSSGLCPCGIQISLKCSKSDDQLVHS